MKTGNIIAFVICCTLLEVKIFGQFTDDILIFPSDYSQTENSIAADPTNPNCLIAACIGADASNLKTLFFWSNDCGLTWTGSNSSPNNVATKGDPFVIFNKFGDAFFINKGDPGINLFKSVDKGAIWNTKPQISNSSYDDKPHINVGISEITKPNVYAVWSYVNPNDMFEINFRKSTDRGESFSDAVNIYSHQEQEALGAYVVSDP